MLREEITIANGSARLSGTIMLPDVPRESPGLVLMGGSGASDRHSGGFFDLLSEHLVESGVAVLAYDKRGRGGSTGRWDTATIDELAADADAALTILRAHERVVADAVGVLGHSEGGWVAVRRCSRREPRARLISNSCPAVSFIDTEEYELAAAGASSGDAATAGLLLPEPTQAAESGCDLSEGQRIFAAARDAPWYDRPPRFRPLVQAQRVDPAAVCRTHRGHRSVPSSAARDRAPQLRRGVVERRRTVLTVLLDSGERPG